MSSDVIPERVDEYDSSFDESDGGGDDDQDKEWEKDPSKVDFHFLKTGKFIIGNTIPSKRLISGKSKKEGVQEYYDSGVDTRSSCWFSCTRSSCGHLRRIT